VEDTVIESRIDPFARGNDVEITVVKTIFDSSISILLRGIVQSPQISSITIAQGDVIPLHVISPVRINCGGPALEGFSADKYFSAGEKHQLSGCSSPQCSERNGELKYSIPVPKGDYTVVLSFTEIYFTSPGSRIFNVFVEDQPVAENLDIVAEGNDVVIAVDFTVSDGFVNIALTKVVENPKISSIEVLPAGSVDAHEASSTMEFPIQINCGGPALGEFSMDQFASKGKKYQLPGCSSPECSERYGELEYSIPVPPGEYIVTLSFTEIYFTSTGSRIFNVLLEGKSIAENLDIVALGKSVVIDTEVKVTDGFVTIELIKIVENPKISTITIVPVGSTPAPVGSPPTSAPTFHPALPQARPDSAHMIVKTIKVYEQPSSNTDEWNLQKTYQFRDKEDLSNEWNLSNWGFDGFDGAFDPSAVAVVDNLLYLKLERNV
jgi:hypothetical protein